MAYVFIPGYEGLYSISEDAIIMSHNYLSKKQPTIIQPWIDKLGRSVVKLCKNGVKKNHYVHRIVAICYIDNPDHHPIVCHKKECFPLDNSKGNLFWGTQKDNMRDMIAKGRDNNNLRNRNPNIGRTGKSHPLSKPVVQLDIEGNIIRHWECAKYPSDHLHIASISISRCCRGLANTAGGFVWRFTN